MTMKQTMPRSTSRKVNGYVKAALALEAVRRKREERYDRYVRPLDRQRDVLAVEAATREMALSGGQQAEARRILAAINGSCQPAPAGLAARISSQTSRTA
jgi:hypothetical protein